jgi:hypothetical protein
MVGLYDPKMVNDFESLARSALAPLLVAGEDLRAVSAAVHQKTFSGQQYAIGITDRRLLLQPVDRHIAAKGAPIVVTPDSIESVRLDGAGEGWWSAPLAVLDASAVTLDLRMRDGNKIKLMMMRGGSGLMGSLNGGEAQQGGVAALASWLSANARDRVR